MFDLFEAAETANRIGELPKTIEEAAPVFRALLERYHAAVLRDDLAAMRQAEEDGNNLAAAMNGDKGRFGIKGGPGAPCYLLEDATRAPAGSVPIHGQCGSFEITVEGVPVRVEYDGMFGFGFSAHRVDETKPFPISDTGYRSFVGAFVCDWSCEGMTVDKACDAIMRAHLEFQRRPKKKRKPQMEGWED